MNRRSFFLALSKGVLAAAATVYCPRILLAPELEQAPMTLVEWAKRVDHRGIPKELFELFSARNEILDDLVFVDAPPEGHRTTILTSLPVKWGPPG